MTDKETINYLKKYKIDFIPLTKKIEKRYYGVLLNKYKKFELGIANTDAYEEFTKLTNLKFLNKYIVLDLNFSEKFIQSVVNQNFKKNHIIICGTSLFKIHKVQKIIKKINCLILNKEELYSLSKIRNIKKSIMKIIDLNPYINIIVSNADKKTYGYEAANFISCKPPKIKPINENGAGDVMTGTYIYYKSKNHKINSRLNGASSLLDAPEFYAMNKYRNPAQVGILPMPQGPWKKFVPPAHKTKFEKMLEAARRGEGDGSYNGFLEMGYVLNSN
jgi:hypothetical protein